VWPAQTLKTQGPLATSSMQSPVVQLDEFLGDMLRVDSQAPLSPAVSEHAVAVAGQPAATAHEAAVLLRSAAAVRRCASGTRIGFVLASPGNSAAAVQCAIEESRTIQDAAAIKQSCITRPVPDAGLPARRRQPGGSRHVRALLVAGVTQPYCLKLQPWCTSVRQNRGCGADSSLLPCTCLVHVPARCV
jgi:hypothetical protein